MVPFETLAKVQIGEDTKNYEGNDFLDDFKLEGRIDGISPAIGRHLKTVFEKGNAPAHYYHQPERGAFVL